MPEKKKPKPKPKLKPSLSQKERFIEYAKEVEADETGTKFRSIIQMIVKKTYRLG
jgi:hypothetical protein